MLAHVLPFHIDDLIVIASYFFHNPDLTMAAVRNMIGQLLDRL